MIKRLLELDELAWNRFENIAVAVAVIAVAIVIAITIYLERTIGF